MNCKQLKTWINEVEQISSTNEKIQWLKDHNDADLLKFFNWFFDNSTVTGIADKKWDKIQRTGLIVANDIFEVFDYLKTHKTGSDEDVVYCKSFASANSDNDEDMEFFKKIFTKNYPFGLSEVTINKVYPNTVPTFDVMLADKYLDLNESQLAKISNNGTREFNITEKMDGFRCTIIKEGENVKLVSRSGKLYEGFVDIEAYALSLPGSFVLDGELLLTDRASIPSGDQYKATSKIASTKDPVKRGVSLNAFDLIPIDEWNTKAGKTPFFKRRALLEDLLKDSTATSPIILVPLLYVGTDLSSLADRLATARKDNWEGLMLRWSDSVYEFKRSKELLKLKPMAEMDLIIDSYEEGTNSNAGKLGAFICHVDHPKFGHIEAKVGGGYSAEDREEYWKNRDELIGRTIECSYFEVTKNTTTGISSIRFPVHKCIKDEGVVPNN